jgi:hypothetical protein
LFRKPDIARASLTSFVASAASGAAVVARRMRPFHVKGARQVFDHVDVTLASIEMHLAALRAPFDLHVVHHGRVSNLPRFTHPSPFTSYVGDVRYICPHVLDLARRRSRSLGVPCRRSGSRAGQFTGIKCKHLTIWLKEKLVRDWATSTDVVLSIAAESLIVSVGGGIIGLALATIAIRSAWLVDAPGLPHSGDIQISWPVLLFASALTSITALVVSLLAAWRERRPDIVAALKDAQRGHRSTRTIWALAKQSERRAVGDLGRSAHKRRVTRTQSRRAAGADARVSGQRRANHRPVITAAAHTCDAGRRAVRGSVGSVAAGAP